MPWRLSPVHRCELFTASGGLPGGGGLLSLLRPRCPCGPAGLRSRFLKLLASRALGGGGWSWKQWHLQLGQAPRGVPLCPPKNLHLQRTLGTHTVLLSFFLTFPPLFVFYELPSLVPQWLGFCTQLDAILPAKDPVYYAHFTYE